MTTDGTNTEWKEYWDSVRGIAEEAIEAEKRGEDANDCVHESVDGAHHVIYTYANLICLRESKNEDAAFDEMGSDALSGCNSFGEVTARLAFYAMQADVMDELDDARKEADAEVAEDPRA